MPEKQSQPWWTFGHVWLVIAGPAIVVVASFVTLYLAITIPDPVITDATAPSGSHSSRGGSMAAANLAPAMQARNHAATGVPAPLKP